MFERAIAKTGALGPAELNIVSPGLSLNFFDPGGSPRAIQQPSPAAKRTAAGIRSPVKLLLTNTKGPPPPPLLLNPRHSLL